MRKVASFFNSSTVRCEPEKLSKNVLIDKRDAHFRRLADYAYCIRSVTFPVERQVIALNFILNRTRTVQRVIIHRFRACYNCRVFTEI